MCAIRRSHASWQAYQNFGTAEVAELQLMC